MEAPAIVARGEADFDLFPYNPSAAAGYAFVVLFGLGAAAHLVLIFLLRAWFFIPFFLGCIGEAFGYYGRAWAHDNIRNGSPYLLQLMLLLASPPFLAASIYMTLGRIIRVLDAEHHSMMRTRWLTKLYVVVDIASFVCQMMGSAMQASGDPSGVKTGQKIVTWGLVGQLIAFLFFIAIGARFHFRLNREPTRISMGPGAQWRKYMWAVYAVSVLVLIRNLYRIIEFVGGTDSVLVKKEAFLYVFDAFLMFLVVIVMGVVHPGQLMRAVNQGKTFIDRPDLEESESFALHH